MCLLDWRLGRMVRSVFHSVAGDASGNATIPANQQRVGLTILEDIAGNFLNISSVNGSTFTGVVIPQSVGSPAHFTIATHGDLPMQAFVIHNGGGVGAAINWIEYIMPESALSKANDYLQQEGFFGGS